MKANQKFTQADDAVSPVIGVILMVAITVVLAAVVFVLVSDLGGDTSVSSFPQVRASDSGSGNYVEFEHRGGDCVDLEDYTITLNSTTVVATGAFCVGETVYFDGDGEMSSDGTTWTSAVSLPSGTHTIRIVDNDGQAIVAEPTVTISG